MSYVYKFVDYDDKIIYIGKTGDIEKRMQKHFSKDGHLPITCYQNVARIFYIEVDGKTNVDMYETYLINKYLPKYNTDKVFNEILELHKNDFIYLEEVEWKELFFSFGKNGIKISKSRIPFPFFVASSNYDRSIALLEYNYYNLLYRVGLYNHYLKDMLNDNEDFVNFLFHFTKEIIDTKNFCPTLSCFDEPINEINDSFEYVAIDIKKLEHINLEYLLIMVQSKMLVRIDKTHYGIVAHTPYALEIFNKIYKYNEFEI